MHKQVNGHECGIGKQLAGRKRNPRNRLALKEGEKGKRVSREEKMQGSGEMVMGRRATRWVARDLSESSIKARHDLMSSSDYKLFEEWVKKNKKRYKTDDEKFERFKVWCCNKEQVDKYNKLKLGGATYGLNFYSDLRSSESAEHMGGRKSAGDPYRGNRRTPEFYDSTYGKHVAEEEAAFEKWAAKHRRNYGYEWEREDKFAAYFQNKKNMEEIRKEYPCCSSTYPDELEKTMDVVYNKFVLESYLLTGSAPSDLCCSAPTYLCCSAPSDLCCASLLRAI